MRNFLSTRADLSWSNGAPVRGAIIVSVILTSAGVALTAADQILGLSVIALAGIGVARIVFGNPALGVLMIIPASVFVTYGLAAGNSTSVGSNLLLVIALTAIWLINGARNGFKDLLPKSGTVAPILALCAIAVLALAFGRLPWFAFAGQAPLTAQLGGLATFLLSAAVFLLAATQIRSVGDLGWLTWILIVVGALVVASSIFRGLLSPIQGLIARGSTGSLFWTWLAAMAFSQVVGNARLRRSIKIVLLMVIAGIFQTHFLGTSSWVSGWLPPLVAMIVIVWVRSLKLGAGLTVAGFAMIIAAFQERVAEVISSNQYSLLTRLEAWKIAGEILQVNPVLGLGPANYYWYAHLFPILGYSVQFSSHNNYVDIVAQTGLLGLMAFIWFAVAMFFLAHRLLSVADDGFERAYVLGVIGGLFATLVSGMLGDWVIPFVYNVGLTGMRASLIGWLFLGGLVALDQIHRTANFES